MLGELYKAKWDVKEVLRKVVRRKRLPPDFATR